MNDIILNLMIHEFDNVFCLLGKPTSIACSGMSKKDGIQEHAHAMLTYNHASVTLEGCVCMPESFPFSTSMRIVCELGAIDLNWHWGEQGPVNDVVLYKNEGNPEKLMIPDYDPYEAECKYLLDSLNGLADGSLLSIENALDSIKMAVTARESFKLDGEKIYL